MPRQSWTTGVESSAISWLCRLMTSSRLVWNTCIVWIARRSRKRLAAMLPEAMCAASPSHARFSASNSGSFSEKTKLAVSADVKPWSAREREISPSSSSRRALASASRAVPPDARASRMRSSTVRAWAFSSAPLIRPEKPAPVSLSSSNHVLRIVSCSSVITRASIPIPSDGISFSPDRHCRTRLCRVHALCWQQPQWQHEEQAENPARFRASASSACDLALPGQGRCRHRADDDARAGPDPEQTSRGRVCPRPYPRKHHAPRAEQP